jgi:hypothetical protein
LRWSQPPLKEIGGVEQKQDVPARPE